MRNIIFGIFLTVSMTALAFPIADEIAAALKTGNAEEIAKYFSESVDLSIPENEGVFSKVQAQLILKTFFSKHQPSNFKQVHQGDSKNNSHYSIGNLTTTNGTFRTYILYKEINNSTVIVELRIESDE